MAKIMNRTPTYTQKALALAEYEKLEDDTYAGKIPGLKGVIAFADSLGECRVELESMLREWIALGLKMGHTLPEL